MRRDRPTEKQEARLLNWVNRARKALGKRPIKRLPKGTPGDPGACVIGKALGLRAYGMNWAPPPGMGWEEMLERLTPVSTLHNGRPYAPEYVLDFIERFDAGDYPGLIK